MAIAAWNPTYPEAPAPKGSRGRGGYASPLTPNEVEKQRQLNDEEAMRKAQGVARTYVSDVLDSEEYQALSPAGQR